MARLRRLQRLAFAAGAAALGAWVSPAPAAAAEPAFSLRGSTSVGVDTNPARIFGYSNPDAVGSALVSGGAKVSLEPVALSGSYEAAGRAFLTRRREDALAQELAAAVAVRPLSTVQAALEGRIWDRRGPHVYTDLQGGLALRWQAVKELEVELRASAHRLIAWSVFDISFAGPEAGVNVRYRFDRRHAVLLSGGLGNRRYGQNAALRIPDGCGAPSPDVQREDAMLSAGASYGYRGGFQLSAGYRYFSQESNSCGHTAYLHRLELSLGTPLPWDWLLLAQVTLQLADYPEGLVISEEEALKSDDEQHNAITLKLVRPLGERVDLEVRYGLYLNRLPENNQSYRRQVGSVGLAFRM